MTARWTVVKIGGSLLEAGHLAALLGLLSRRRGERVAVVPGGGVFADAVRLAQGLAGLSDGTAHRLALDAMSQMGGVIAALHPAFAVTGATDAFDGAVAQGLIPVWSPVDLKAGNPAIPETWAVTSDSLALWLGAALGAERVILVKATECDGSQPVDALAREGIVDAAFPDFARRFSGDIAFLGPGLWHRLGSRRPDPANAGAVKTADARTAWLNASPS